MTPKRKIGITCYPTYGGSGVVATELGIELAARGHEVHFITSSAPFRLNGREANIHFHEVDVFRYPLFEHPPYDLALATRMAEVAEFYSLDLLHVHYAIPHSLSALLARQMLETQQDAARRRYLPFITTLHGTDITLVGLDRSYLPITQFGIEQSDGVTAISNYLRERTREAFNIQGEIEVIRNFVNCDVYVRVPTKVAAMRPRYASGEEKLLVHLSNFRPVKRILDVVEVFARVAKALPARLMMIGDGPDRSAAEHLAVRLGVADRSDADAIGDGVVWPGRAGGDGLLRAFDRDRCRWRFRADRRRPQRATLPTGRRGGYGQRRHRPAARRRPSPNDVRSRPQERQRPILLQPDYSAV